jgi:NitT/TauT family transport system ATP-binding protein
LEDENEIEKKVMHFLKEVGLEKFANKYPYELSGGMRQLLSIARAFAYEPDFFLMDEPFSALDYENRIKMEDRVLELWSKHKKTIIFISHDIEEAVYLADRIVVLSKRPTKVKEIFEIKLKRPRNMKTRFSEDFHKMKNKVLQTFRREI